LFDFDYTFIKKEEKDGCWCIYSSLPIDLIPERIDYITLQKIANIISEQKLLKQKIIIDKVRFDLMKDKKDNSISQLEALQFFENKFAPIFYVLPKE